jgi:hypothetical protein
VVGRQSTGLVLWEWSGVVGQQSTGLVLGGDEWCGGTAEYRTCSRGEEWCGGRGSRVNPTSTVFLFKKVQWWWTVG